MYQNNMAVACYGNGCGEFLWIFGPFFFNIKASRPTWATHITLLSKTWPCANLFASNRSSIAGLLVSWTSGQQKCRGSLMKSSKWISVYTSQYALWSRLLPYRYQEPMIFSFNQWVIIKLPRLNPGFLEMVLRKEPLSHFDNFWTATIRALFCPKWGIQQRSSKPKWHGYPPCIPNCSDKYDKLSTGSGHVYHCISMYAACAD